MGKKVLLAGYYGFSNTGDEAILSAMLSDLRAEQPELEFIVVSGNPEQTAAQHQVSSVLYIDWDAIIESARQSDLIILGGGGLFHDYWGFDAHTLLTRDHWSISFYSAFPLLATLLDKPLMLFAIGVGPLLSEAGQKYTAFAFEQAWLSTVRDTESKEILLSPRLDGTKIKVTADPAYLITPSPKEQVIDLLAAEGYSSSGELLIGVSLRKWEIGVQQENWAREVADALDLLIERYKAKVVFVPLQRDSETLTDDYAISNSVRSLMHNQSQTFTLEKEYSVEEMAGILAHCNFVIGMRLHSIIFAANAGVPVLALVYDPKVGNAMRQLGCEKYALDLSVTNSVELLRLFADAYSNRQELSTQLQSAVESLKPLARENIHLAMELLNHPERYRPALPPQIIAAVKETTLNLALRLARENRKRDAREQQIHERMVQLAEQEQMTSSLSAQLSEQKQSLVKQITEKDRTIQFLSGQLAQERQRIEKLLSQLSESVQHSLSLMSELTQKRAEIEALSSQASHAEQNAQSLSAQLATKERANEVLALELAMKDDELKRVTSSLGWRLLNRYGQIKYRYLLPIYKALGLPPYHKKSVAGDQTPQEPFEQFAKAVEPLEFSPKLDSTVTQSLAEGLSAHGATKWNAYDVVCFPIIDWDFRFQRPQQLMSRFAEAGHRVFYISQNFYSSGPAYLIQEKQKNIFEVSLRGPKRIVYKDIMDDTGARQLFRFAGCVAS